MPIIAIKNPRGLSENRIQDIEKDLNKRAKDNEGMMVLYELIQASRICSWDFFARKMKSEIISEGFHCLFNLLLSS